MSHTKEPWILQDSSDEFECDIGLANGNSVALSVGKGNARRIVACINACEGISTEDLESYYNTGGGIDEALEEASLQSHVKAIKQRDELLAALEQAEQWLSGWSSADPYLTFVRAAIAKGKGVTQ